MESEMLNWLRSHLKETPFEKLKAEWAEIEDKSNEGINACEYIKYLSTLSTEGLALHVPPDSKFKLSNNQASNVFEAFFC